MKILFLANKDIASNLALNYILPVLKHHQIKLLLSEHVGQARDKAPALSQLAFFEQTLFNDIVFPLLDKSNNHSKKNMLSFNQLDKKYNLYCESVISINTAASIIKLRSLNPDLIISIRFGQILKQSLIDIPSFGVLNLHSSLLPNYKGVMATFRAMLNAERFIGMTLHFIDNKQIDQGDIVSQCHQPINRSKSYLWNVLQLYPNGCRLIINAVNALEKQGFVASKSQPEGGEYFTFPNNEALQKFTELGLYLYDEREIVELINEKYLQGWQVH